MLLFVSDTHFGLGTPDDQEKRRQNFFACLDEHADRIEKLFIIGDLFDFWFEWKHVILKRHFQVLCKLKGLTQKGVELHYLAGNHDFALGSFLQQEIGAHLHLDHFQFEIGGRKFYLSHGDGLAPADWGYRILKRVFRSRFNQKLYSWFHPDFGLELAHLCSFTSRNHTGRRWDVDGYAYHDAAQKKAQEGFDYILFAHTHEPVLEPVNGGIYVNTGDWLKYYSYATYQDGIMSLKYWGQPHLQQSEKSRSPG
jgi:UDP-2,3-diacylglucosamine hydrolase